MRTSMAKGELSNLRCKAQTFALKLTETENKHAIRQNLIAQCQSPCAQCLLE